MYSFYDYMPNLNMAYGGAPKRKGTTFSGNLFYQGGGSAKFPRRQDYQDEISFLEALSEWANSMSNASPDLEMVNPSQIDQLQVNPSQVATQAVQASLVPPAANVPATSSNKFKLNPYTGVSVVDFLKLQGAASDLSSRKKLAQLLGIENYKPDIEGNTKLMEAVKQNPEVLKNYAKGRMFTQDELNAYAKKVQQNTKTVTWNGKKYTQAELNDINKRLKANTAKPIEKTKASESSFNFPAGNLSGENISYNQAFLNPTEKFSKSSGSKVDPYATSIINRDRSQRGPIVDDEMGRAIHNAILDVNVGNVKNAALLAGPELIGAGWKYFAPRYFPYNSLQLPERLPITNPGRLLQAPPTPRGWEIPSQGLRSPGYPMYDDGGQLGGTFIPEYGQFAYGGYHSEIPSLFNQPVDRMNKAMYGMGMASGGQMPQWLAERRFTAAGNRDKMSDYGYAQGGEYGIGDEIEVTPEQLEMLKQQGYKFKITG